VSRARISQAIKKQERRIGGVLFERSSRHVRLTPLGAILREDLQAGYRRNLGGIDTATALAAGKTTTLRVGMFGVNIPDLQPFFNTFHEANPECELQVRHADFGNPFGPLRGGAVDLLLAWLPIQEPDLTVGPVVYTEPIVLMAATDHPLAARKSVSYEDLADPYGDGRVRACLLARGDRPVPHPSGRPIPIGPRVTNVWQMMAVASSGEEVSPVHVQSARYIIRPDVTYVPIQDAPLSQWALIWRTDAETDLIRSLTKIVRDIGPLALYMDGDGNCLPS
jgi:DNA-binding transcriptional LysR family regulator